ncbi:universal stress protein [Citricoccus sp. GCM10030269]|uniref:universal stress protein n=1 Tax=Citricoccus sp. GCM10030269 TaxID=3273388 RepID=UPI00361D8AAD
MNIVVAMTASPEARAAALAAIDEAALRGADVVLMPEPGTVSHHTASEPATGTATDPVSDPELAGHAAAHGVTLRQDPVPDGTDFGDALIDASYLADTAMVVIGLRRRSPVGKLFLGSTSQRILLEAGCPVHAVKVSVGARR